MCRSYYIFVSENWSGKGELNLLSYSQTANNELKLSVSRADQVPLKLTDSLSVTGTWPQGSEGSHDDVAPAFALSHSVS